MPDRQAKEKSAKIHRRAPRRITESYLENAALFYLERYASSVENFRRVLMRKVDRAARFHDDDPADGAALVTALIARYQQVGLLDDRRYAEMRARSLHNRGDSLRSVRGKLLVKGVPADIVEAAIATLHDDRGDLDLRAARVFARKRRFGPYRSKPDSPELRQKELAALGRAGFDYDIARRVVDAKDIAELQDEISAE